LSTFLITGVNGFIGSHIAERLIKDGHRVRGLVRKTSDLKFIRGMKIELLKGDITNTDSLPSALKNTEIVIHVAGLASDWGGYEDFYRINVQGTMNIARMAAEFRVKRFIQISTVAFFGFGHKTAVKETDPMVKTIFPYNETKRLAEEWLFEFDKECDMEITAIRPGNVFGPRDHTFIEKYLDALEKGRLAYIRGGKSKTCPVFIDNLVDGIISACFSVQAPGEAFFITDGLDINWKEFTDAFADEMDLPRPKLSVPFRLVYVIAFLMEMIYKLLRIKKAPLLTRYRISNGGMDYFFSIDKAKALLGYNPSVNFVEGVKRTVKWYQSR
jgi:nucleoside-diphosphate-sugar epimerase